MMMMTTMMMVLMIQIRIFSLMSFRWKKSSAPSGLRRLYMNVQMSVMVRLVDFQMTVTQLGFTAFLETPLYGGKEKTQKRKSFETLFLC